MLQFLFSLDEQCEGPSSGEADVERPDDEEDDGERKREALHRVGNRSRLQNEKAAAG